MPNQEKIKAFTPLKCPHCQGELLVSTELESPTNKVYMPGDIQFYKKMVTDFIGKSTDPADLAIIAWVGREDTIIDEEDATMVINSIKTRYATKTS